MLVSWVIQWSKSQMPHWDTSGNCPHQAWVIWDLRNLDLVQIISNDGSQKRVTLSLESLGTILFHATASNIKKCKLRQHSSNCGIPCFVNLFGSFQATWISPTWIQVCSMFVQWISFWQLPIVRYSSPACWSHENVVNWVLPDVYMTVTIVGRVGCWSSISHHQSPVIISL